MSVIDDYLKNIEPPKREQLQRIRELAKKIVPSAEEVISYKMPTLKYQSKAFLGFDARKNHIGIYPYSGHIIEKIKDRLQAYGLSRGAIRIPINEPIPESLLKELIIYRIQEIESAAQH